MGRPAIDATLQRMGRDAQERLLPDVAREVALREGLKAFVRVDILTSGDARYISAALVSAESGELLDSDAVIALHANDVVTATDQLAETVRGRFPARVESIAGRERMSPLTTRSIHALLKHMEGFLAYRLRGDNLRAIELAEEAITIDPDFAQAWLNLSFYLGAQGSQDRRFYDALLEAYRLRDRLSPYERYLIEGVHFVEIENDLTRGVDRYLDHVIEAKKFGRDKVVVSYRKLAYAYVLLAIW
jgi:tetratricopeptide (TPR) repeat protein